MTCAKVKVECWIVHPSGAVFYGSNDCGTPQEVCPRVTAGQTHGEGYEKCHHICNQPGHAEIMALRAAGEWARGSTAFVGHDWVCQDCENALYKAGVDRVFLAQKAPVFWQKM